MNRLAEQNAEGLGPLKGIPPLLLKNRWIQLEIRQRNTYFIAYTAARVQIFHPEVMTIFAPDQNDDAAAEAGDEPVVCPESDDEDDEPVIGAAAVTPEPLGATPWLVFAAERRREVKRANPALSNNQVSMKLAELWRALSPEGRAA